MGDYIDLCSLCVYGSPSSSNGGCCICPAVGRDVVNEYDKIRAMSDGEMKNWIRSLWDVASHMGMLRANEIQEAMQKVVDETMKQREEYMSKTTKLFLDDEMEEWTGG